MGSEGFVRGGLSRLHVAVLAVLSFTGASGASGAPCTPVPVYDAGSVPGVVCAEAPVRELVLVSLEDAWVPRILSETPELPQAYGATFSALANERLDAESVGPEQRRDRYFELFGIFPSIDVVRRRLLDAQRHDCHAGVDDTGLRDLQHPLAPWDPRPGPARTLARRAAVVALQAHLACERLLPPKARAGSFDAATAEALGVYHRLHMIPSLPVLDAATREVLLTPSRELDFRSLLRALRERVVDATGLLEDGSASNAWEPVLGRSIDALEYRYELRAAPLQRGAPDLVSRATEAAATALGWVSPETAAAALAQPPPGLIALQLPEAPSYHASPLSLRAEIDRGDVWTAYPLDARGRALPSPVVNRPTLTLFARTASGEVPLVRWPTTIGGWQRENIGQGTEVWRYKPSPTGHFVWRELIAAPAWFPPPSTPDRELVRELGGGRWTANDRAVGPGYASAYGLVALLHHRAATAAGGPPWIDVNVRTHGSGNYRSILRGSSHGCHRLFNHLAIRLGSFLLAQGGVVRHGQSTEQYRRVVRWQGRVHRLHAASRGYRFELTQPIDVDVLPGRPARGRRSSTPGAVSGAPGDGPLSATAAGCR
jgi:hypothetical protein